MDDSPAQPQPDANADRDAEQVLWVKQVARRDDGSHTAWSQLFGAYRIKGIGFCRRNGLTVDDAEDLVQDMMLTVHDKAAQFTKGNTPWPWIKSILRNSMIDRFKKASTRYEQAVDDLTEFSDALPVGPPSTVPQSVIDDCRQRYWAGFVAAYPQGALALTMRVDGAAIPEIAESLQRTETATRKFLSSMRKKADEALSHCE